MPLFRWALAIVILIVAGALVRIRTYDVITSSAQAFWNDHELFVLVSQNKLAWSENLWAFVWRSGEGIVGFSSPPTFRRIDCLLYHFKAGSLGDYLIKDMNAAGIFVPYKGSIYSLAGGDSQRVFKWDGSRFASIPANEASALQASFTYTDELFKREGWSQINPLLPVRGSAEHQLVLNGIPASIRATQSSDGESIIELITTRGPDNSRVVYKFKNTSGCISSGRYQRFVE
jgi:hypothetical protein